MYCFPDRIFDNVIRSEVTGLAQKRTVNKVIDHPMKDKVRNRSHIDYTFLFAIVLMVCVGMVMLLSASTPAARTKYGDSYYFFNKQLLFVAIGFVGMIIASHIDYKFYKKYAPYIFGVALFLIVIVAIPGIGRKLNGSRRWLPLPGFNFQPSELMKLSIAILFAQWLDEGYGNIKTSGLG